MSGMIGEVPRPEEIYLEQYDRGVSKAAHYFDWSVGDNDPARGAAKSVWLLAGEPCVRIYGDMSVPQGMLEAAAEGMNDYVFRRFGLKASVELVPRSARMTDLLRQAFGEGPVRSSIDECKSPFYRLDRLAYSDYKQETCDPHGIVIVTTRGIVEPFAFGMTSAITGIKGHPGIALLSTVSGQRMKDVAAHELMHLTDMEMQRHTKGTEGTQSGNCRMPCLMNYNLGSHGQLCPSCEAGAAGMLNGMDDVALDHSGGIIRPDGKAALSIPFKVTGLSERKARLLAARFRR